MAGVFALARPHLAEWGISLFVMLSALSLALNSNRLTPPWGRVRQRISRLLVPLWIVGVPYVLAGLALGEMPIRSLWKVPVWFAGLGVISPSAYLPVSQAWWYVTLAVQCVLIGPLLNLLIARLGTIRTVAVLVAVGLASLLAVDALPFQWQYLKQGLVLCRLPEIAAGLLSAQVLLRRSSLLSVLGSVILVLLASTLAGLSGAVTSSLVVLSWLAVLLVLSTFATNVSASGTTLRTVALGTYPFYLVHAPIGKYLIIAAASIGVRTAVPLAIAAMLFSSAAAFAVLLLDRVFRARVHFETHQGVSRRRAAGRRP